MSDFILLTNDEVLEHHGILGQKWGVRRYQNKDGSLTNFGKYQARKIRGHAGPGQNYGTKRQLARDKKDLEYLNKGGHLSVGFTKKHQAKYDARDKAIIQDRIKRNEQKLKTNNKKWSTKKKIIVGTALATTVVGGIYGTKKIKEIKRNKYFSSNSTLKTFKDGSATVLPGLTKILKK